MEADRSNSIVARRLGPDDVAVLDNVAEDVFDNPVDRELAREFLADARHHLVVALAGDQVIGIASALHYVHPDKPPELWINEVGVAPTWQNRGVGRRVMAAMFNVGRALGCRQAWVVTEQENAPARRLYAAVGGVESPEDLVMVEFKLKADG